jgi:hypothetical protein
MAFCGKAADSTGVFLDTPEDLSDVISLISPREIPFLDLVGDSQTATTQRLHRWSDGSSSRRNKNYTKVFEEAVPLTSEVKALLRRGIRSGLAHQVRYCLRKALRGLEECVLGSIDLADSTRPGTSTAMRGLLSFLTPVDTRDQRSPDHIGIAIRTARQNGGTDLDVIMCGALAKLGFYRRNDCRFRTVIVDGEPKDQFGELEDSFGQYEIKPHPRFPRTRAAIISTDRITIVARQGNSFHYEPGGSGEVESEGVVAGEYTLQVKNGAGMAQLNMPWLVG